MVCAVHWDQALGDVLPGRFVGIGQLVIELCWVGGEAPSGAQALPRTVPTTSLPATNPGHESALRKQMSLVLEDGADPDARLAAVIATISASSTLVLLHPLPRLSGKVATRAKEIEQGNWVAAALTIAVAGTTASLAAASAAAVATTHS